jgi:hypothetical protein
MTVSAERGGIMTEHQDIQNPDDYTDKDYDKFEKKLFAPTTSVKQLEKICMTLAHLPTKRAQELLERFSQSDRACEVLWLESAIEEGQFHYLAPTNEQEERDYLALEVIEDIEDELCNLQGKYDDLRVKLDKRLIEHNAILELIRQGELNKDEALGFENVQRSMESEMKDLATRMAVKEKTLAQIKKSITTERSKNVNRAYRQDIPF